MNLLKRIYYRHPVGVFTLAALVSYASCLLIWKLL